MPTPPTPELLPLNATPEVQALLDRLADGLDEVVRFGARVFVWHSEASAGKEDEVLPVALLLRHQLGMLDAISVLIRSSVVEPAALQLRTAFEANLQIEWILQHDSHRRGMAFMVWHAHQRLKLYHRFDRSTAQGQELARRLEGSLYEGIDVRDSFDLSAARANMESLLTTPRYRDAAKAYEQMKERKKNPPWYALFKGPDNIEQLARRLKKSDWYELLYRQWSGVVHATDIVTGKVSSRDGQTRIAQLRWPGEVESVYSFSVAVALQTYRRLLTACASERMQDYRTWYLSEVRPLFRPLASRTRIDPESGSVIW